MRVCTMLRTACALAAVLTFLTPHLSSCTARSVPVSSATLVTTPSELKAALGSAVEHIVVTQHLDLRELAAGNSASGGRLGPASVLQAAQAVFEALWCDSNVRKP